MTAKQLKLYAALPISTLMGSTAADTSAAVRAFLTGPHAWTADERAHTVEITDTIIASQPVGAMFDHLLTMSGDMPQDKRSLFKGEIGIFNIGLNTADVLVIANGAPVERFTAGDTGFRVIDRERRDLVLGHWSPNFDHTGIALDLNVVYPIDRLEELAANGTIGAVAPRHISFAGNQPDDVSTVRLDSGPRAAQLLKDDGVDVVLLTPV